LMLSGSERKRKRTGLGEDSPTDHRTTVSCGDPYWGRRGFESETYRREKAWEKRNFPWGHKKVVAHERDFQRKGGCIGSGDRKKPKSRGNGYNNHLGGSRVGRGEKRDRPLRGAPPRGGFPGSIARESCCESLQKGTECSSVRVHITK